VAEPEEFSPRRTTRRARSTVAIHVWKKWSKEKIGQAQAEHELATSQGKLSKVEAEYNFKKNAVDELEQFRKNVWNRIGGLRKELVVHQRYRTCWRHLTSRLLKKAALGKNKLTAVEKTFVVDGYGGVLSKKTGHRPGEHTYSISRKELAVHF
jgi:hypothetical protein